MRTLDELFVAARAALTRSQTALTELAVPVAIVVAGLLVADAIVDLRRALAVTRDGIDQSPPVPPDTAVLREVEDLDERFDPGGEP